MQKRKKQLSSLFFSHTWQWLGVQFVLSVLLERVDLQNSFSSYEGVVAVLGLGGGGI